MTWHGYLKWVQRKKKEVEACMHAERLWEAQDLAEKALFSLHRTTDFARKQGYGEAWQGLSRFFQQKLADVDSEPLLGIGKHHPGVANGLGEELFSPVESDDGNNAFGIQAPRQAMEWEKGAGNKKVKPQARNGVRIKELMENGDLEQARGLLLKRYEEGEKSFKLVKAIYETLEKQGKLQEAADFLAQAILESDFSAKEQAQLLYLEALCLIRLEKFNLARQALWKLKKVFPAFPGVEDKLKLIDRQRKRSSTKYDLLLEKKMIDKDVLEEARSLAAKQGKDLDQFLIEQCKVPKKELGRSLSAFYDVDFVSFDPNVETPFEIFEKRRLDPEFLKRYCWVPYKQEGNTIEVLMVNPFDLGKLDEIRFILGTSKIEPKVALKADIEAYIEHFFRELTGDQDLEDFDEEVEAAGEEELDDFEDTVSEEDSEVVRLVNALLIEAWKKGASDIHVEPNSISKYCAVRFRIDGTCHEFKKLRFRLARPMVSRIKIMARLDIAERRLPQDGKVKIKLPQVNKVVEFRVATLPTIDNQEDVVLRVLASGKPLPLEKLGLAENNLKSFQEKIYQPYGLILVVGPTGSGKTTTLHSALNYINTPDRKIWTAEDPVEITQEGLRQVQINPKIGLDFASALRSFLRADPDVIMIGEMRDKETAHIGVEASLTGHLVFSTLHTNSAPETITRLLDMDLDPFNFADSLLCVLAQRLIKTLCPNCKEEFKPSEAELKELKEEFGPEWKEYFPESFLKSPVLYRAKGCRACMGGYKGRIGIHELMLNTPPIKELIKYRKPTEELRSQAKKDGMLSLKQDGLLKVVQGITDIVQVRAVAGKS